MWTIPAIPHGAHDIDIHRPEKTARPENDPKRRNDSRRVRNQGRGDEQEEFEIDTFERHAGEAEGKWQSLLTPAKYCATPENRQALEKRADAEVRPYPKICEIR